MTSSGNRASSAQTVRATSIGLIQKILESISLLQVTHTARTTNSRVRKRHGVCAAHVAVARHKMLGCVMSRPDLADFETLARISIE